jgi:hypothetical protein
MPNQYGVRRLLKRKNIPLVVIAALFTTSCATTVNASDGISPHWVGIIRDIRSDNPSENVIEILADYQVSDGEVQLVSHEFESCLEQQWRTRRDADGTLTLMYPLGGIGDTHQDLDDVISNCETTTGATDILWLHSEMNRNPRGLTWAQMVRECFEEAGEPSGMGLSEELFEELVGLTPDFIAETDSGRKCHVDPLGEMNLTMEQVEEREANRSIVQWSWDPETGESTSTTIE